MARRPLFSRRGEQAIQANREAALYAATPALAGTDAEYYARQSEFSRARASILLEPTKPVSIGAGGEAISWENKPDEPFLGAHARIIDTLEHPNTVSVGASSDRTSAAISAGILEAAVDAAQSAQASNSIEKMLCHQMAGAHFGAMRLLGLSANEHLAPSDQTRFINAAARLMDVYQAACLTLQKLKTGGAQRIIVQQQQVNVGAGGQALVTGKVQQRRGTRTRRRGRKNR